MDMTLNSETNVNNETNVTFMGLKLNIFYKFFQVLAEQGILQLRFHV